ncbi:hypothetical protein EN866_33835 [Mesorhizobium sp. M2D.F.Ca.ET.223.01.1.1]|uniref:hypothetical protein n=1 Tax=Mesorhizobium sp. M2D.F.Ca.ET.223.01.1.1 TaxID=2563940 RepID=UPI001091AE67|nr:hypothetical protein [Mesorhizobium sp. M2D.F.Ca.ET.223.01.1.1]TGR83609.1 hypothetical protein EN866_33835 [Mesorhizobium sp. M2D.F.Ca.ET.223.01.1.1]TGT74567.1 hypothetical protein EN802_12030 [bacterium M00.F.Ca.ET.159.01.1.1]TGT86817.1 hypothetical protein EN800_08920 [bacterium M00.F.Ca.ET.157.01.1.1]
MAVDAPMSVDERLIEQFHAVDPITREKAKDDDLDDLAGAVKAAREAAQRIVKFAEVTMRDRTQMPDAGILQIRTHALSSSAAVATKLDAARTKIAGALEQFDKETASPALSPATAPFEAEIRAVFKTTMSQAQREAAINDAFKTGNKMVLGAILRLPSYMSALSPAYLEIVRHRYRKQFFASQYERVVRLKKALALAEEQGSTFVRFVDRIANSPAVTLAQAAQQAREELQAIYRDAA